MRRAASKLRDIALCNDFRYFVTLTLDPAKIDRHDMDALVRVLNRWADNRVRRHGLRYVLVPERHKDGAIHLHGFFKVKHVLLVILIIINYKNRSNIIYIIKHLFKFRYIFCHHIGKV